MKKRLIILSSFLGMLAVLLGAFGSHGLKNILSPKMMEIYKTANFYHFIHSTLATFLSFQLRCENKQIIKIAILLFIIGIFIFSGSLYILAITQISWLGAITPVGGFCFILGWFFLILFAIKQKD